jgi:hypothetical protein
VDANDNNAPKIVAALQYDAGAEHRPALDGFTAAVIAIRFIAISELLGISWSLYSLVGAIMGRQDDAAYTISSALSVGVSVASGVLLWLLAEPIARWMLPKSMRVGSATPVNVHYAAIGIALIGLYSVIDGVPFLIAVVGGYLSDLWLKWFPPAPSSSTTYFSSTSVWYDSGQRVLTLGVAVAQIILGLVLLWYSKRLARWRVFRG